MAYELIALQGYRFMVGHGEFVVPDDLPPQPGAPEPGTTVAVHTMQLLDASYDQQGNIVAVRRAYEIELSDRQRDELVRQLQGGAPQPTGPAVAVADASILHHLPHPFPETGGK